MQEKRGRVQEVLVFRARGDEMERWPIDAANLDAASAQVPYGAYTTLRTYEGRKILHLEDHWTRLRDSALRLDERSRVTLTRPDLARTLGQALEQAGFDESRIRLTLTVPEGALFVGLQRFDALPTEWFEKGVPVALCAFVPHSTQAKSTASITPLRGAKASLPAWANEGIMVDQAGRMLEGLSSNFFAVRGGALYTAHDTIVAGTTRAIVLGLAADMLPLAAEPVHVSELGEVTECFLTSVSRQVLPVVRVDGLCVGDGRPGVMTRELLRRFRDYVSSHAEAV